MTDFPRSVDIRGCEAIRNLVLADSIAAAYWKQNVRVGPDVTDDGSINTPQLSILPALDGGFRPGTSGSSNSDIAIVVAMFERYTASPYKVGEVSPKCRLKYLAQLIATGTVASNGTTGKLIDPDNPDATDGTLYLNVAMPTFRWASARVHTNTKGDPVALLYPLIVEFETRLDNFTLQRTT